MYETQESIKSVVHTLIDNALTDGIALDDKNSVLGEWIRLKDCEVIH